MSGTEPHAGGSRWLAPGSPGVYLFQEGTGGRDAARPAPVTVSLDRVAGLRTERSRRALGLPRLRPSQKQWPAFRAVGERLVVEAAQAVLYTSAGRTRSLCLCVFEPGLAGLAVAGEPVRLLAAPALPRGLRT